MKNHSLKTICRRWDVVVLTWAPTDSPEPVSQGNHCRRVEYPSQARFFLVHWLQWGYVSSHLSFLARHVQQPVNVLRPVGRFAVVVDRELDIARLPIAKDPGALGPQIPSASPRLASSRHGPRAAWNYVV